MSRLEAFKELAALAVAMLTAMVLGYCVGREDGLSESCRHRDGVFVGGVCLAGKAVIP